MKKTIAIIVLILTLLLCACQKNPGREPVTNKGDGLMEKIVLTTPAPDGSGGFLVPTIDVPARWDEVYELYGGEISFEAEISYEEEAHPVYLTEDVGLDEAKLDKLLRFFLEPSKWRAIDQSREFLIKRLEAAMKGMPTGLTDPETGEEIYTAYEGQDELIESLMKQLEELPEETWESYDGFPNGPVFITDGVKQVYCSKSNNTITIEPDYNVGFRSEVVAVQLAHFQHIEGQENITELPEPSMPKEDAIELTHELLAELGINEETFGIAYMNKGELMNSQGEVEGYGWVVSLKTRAPAAKYYDPYYYDLNAGPIGTNRFAEEGAFRPPIESDLMELYFQDGELKGASWVFPQRVISVVNPAVELMPFGDIQDKIRDVFKYGLAWIGERGNSIGSEYFVAEVALSYLKTAKMNDLNEYWFAPVWAVEFRSRKMPDALTFVFFINAIDGSLVSFE